MFCCVHRLAHRSTCSLRGLYGFLRASEVEKVSMVHPEKEGLRMDSRESAKKINDHNELYYKFLDSCEKIYPEIPRDVLNDAFQNVILNLTTFGSDGLIINHEKFIKKMQEPKMKKFITDVKMEKEEKLKQKRMTNLLCDREFFWSGEVCGGRLYKTHKGVLAAPIRPDIQWIRYKCEKCGKKYKENVE